MAEQGVVVSFNSDSDDELARRLNTRGGQGDEVRPEGQRRTRRIKFVTLNPAKQLGIESASAASRSARMPTSSVWSGVPISSLSRCEATYVDGRRYFSLEGDTAHREKIKTERRSADPESARAITERRRRGHRRRQPGGGGGFGGRRRPPNENDAASLVQYYLDLMTRGQDPASARQGECGERAVSDKMMWHGDAGHKGE